MNYQEAKELHDLLFSFMGLFHEKFLLPFRSYFDSLPWLKKNHIKIINILYQYEYLTSTEIGRKLDIEKGSLTALIDQLEENCLVTRTEDANDRRKSLISLSTGGRSLIEKMIDCHTRQINQHFNAIQPEEAEEFVANLRTAVNFMKKI